MCQLIKVIGKCIQYLQYMFLSGNISIRVLDFRQTEIMTKASKLCFLVYLIL
jgi:hypothetical protein